jgi:adenosylmethionine-8-amino-7-oxononanoate aminotransferase
VDRGQADRWQVISPAQAYHGSTLGTLALSGRRRSLQDPYAPYLPGYLHIPPSTSRLDPTGEAALAELDRALKQAGPETVSVFFCEPVSAAAMPGYSPPDRFWHGLAERREKYGFVVCFDEIVTGMGRVGGWLAAHQLPFEPDIVTIGKGLGAGYTPLAAILCREHIYDALAEGSAEFDLGHTWDGAPLPCAVGLAVLDYIVRHKLVDRVRERGPQLLAQLQAALAGSDIVGEVRGRGYLLGVSLVDPRDGKSFLPHELDAATLVDDIAFELGLLVSSTHSTLDGYAGDEVVLAPAYTSTDDELDEMVERFKGTVDAVEKAVRKKL